jgi:PAS domain S-box-containing protein
MIPISRRLNHPDHSFAGIVFLEVASTHFTQFYAEVPRQADDVMALIGLDGVLRARQAGENHNSGENLTQLGILAAQSKNRSGSVMSTSSIDGVRRFVSYRTLESFPLLVIVGVAEKDALAAVAARARHYYLRATVLTLVIASFAFLLVRAVRRRDTALAKLTASEATLRAREEEFRTVTESMPQMVWITKADGTHDYFNQRWLEYTGLSLEQSVGDGWTAAFDPDEREGAMQRWNETVAKGEPYEAEYRLRGAMGPIVGCSRARIHCAMPRGRSRNGSARRPT